MYKHVAFIIGILAIYLLLFNSVSSHEQAIAYDNLTGQAWVQSPGVYFTDPLTQVAVVDMRPHRVCLETTARVRVTTCKLVRFRPDKLKDLVRTEGFRYYWLSNRLSFNSGYEEEYRGTIDLLRGYAFSDMQYSFIEEL